MMKGQAKRLDPFKDNLYRRTQDAAGAHVLEKSCPKCSKKAGSTVYYAEADFAAVSKVTGAPEIKRDCHRHRKAVAVGAEP